MCDRFPRRFSIFWTQEILISQCLCLQSNRNSQACTSIPNLEIHSFSRTFKNLSWFYTYEHLAWKICMSTVYMSGAGRSKKRASDLWNYNCRQSLWAAFVLNHWNQLPFTNNFSSPLFLLYLLPSLSHFFFRLKVRFIIEPVWGGYGRAQWKLLGWQGLPIVQRIY